MYTTFDKAIAGFVAALLALIATTKWGGPLADPTVQTTITSIVVSVVVYLVPNKGAVAKPDPNPVVAIIKE